MEEGAKYAISSAAVFASVVFLKYLEVVFGLAYLELLLLAIVVAVPALICKSALSGMASASTGLAVGSIVWLLFLPEALNIWPYSYFAALYDTEPLLSILTLSVVTVLLSGLLGRFLSPKVEEVVSKEVHEEPVKEEVTETKEEVRSETVEKEPSEPHVQTVSEEGEVIYLICKFCSEPVPEKALYCPHCGKPMR